MRRDATFPMNEVTVSGALPGIGQRCSFTPDSVYLAVAHTATPFISIYKRNGDSFEKLSNPDVLPTGAAIGCSFSPDGVYLVVPHAITPFMTIYKRNGDSFEKLANPSTLPAGAGRGCAFSSDGAYLAVAHEITPFIRVYKRSGDSFAYLAGYPVVPNTGNDCSFSPDGTLLAVAHKGSPFLTLCKRSGDSFTAVDKSLYTLPGSEIQYCEFSSDGKFLVAGTMLYAVALTNIANIIAGRDNFTSGTHRGAAFSPKSEYMAVTHSGQDSNYHLAILRRNGYYFNTIESSTAARCYGNSCVFSPNGEFLAIGSASSPFVNIYRMLGDETIRNVTPDGYQNFGTNEMCGIGMALEDAAVGQKVRVNLFDPINEVWGG